MWKLWVRTYEWQDGNYMLVLEHAFFGKTKKEALHYSDSHSKTDTFYRDTGGATAARESFNQNGAHVVVNGNFRDIATQTDAEFKKRKR